MRKLIALVLFLMSPAALAADLPVRKAQAPLGVVETWEGLYWGIQGGWNLGSFNPIFGTGTTATEVNLDDNSPFVGGHLGYLVQAGAFVVGPEVGVQYWGFKSQAELRAATTTTPAVLLQQKIDWLAYANVRLGFSPFASTLVYLTGGAAWMHNKGDVLNLASLDTSFEQSALGWNIGVGVEFKIFNDRLSLGGEYRHYDFGKMQSANPALALALGLAADKMTVDQALARISYRLN